MVAANCILVSGPSRGGKSEWAEYLVSQMDYAYPVVYVATGGSHGSDAAWQERLALHRQRRPSSWQLREVGADLIEAFHPSSELADHLVLLDSLGSWVAHHLALSEPEWLGCQANFLRFLADRLPPTVVVAEEVGWGVVPPTAVGGLFRDRCGRLTRDTASLCSQRWLVLDGQALPLHQLATPLPPRP